MQKKLNRYVCVHGHFYQPPRENAWLETVEIQPSAHPYHDWNERVTTECYASNTAAQLLDARGKISELTNNYSRISFDFGPTLLSWLETGDPETYRAVLDADRQSRERFSGHGSAIAQAYNHLILPLASRRDKHTQIVWGMRDFEHRFGRKPEGMWLPETAVDPESLEIMARIGVRFTILAPHQAARVRKKTAGRADAADWQDVPNGSIDTTVPYDVRLPSGRSISVFFYNGPLARAVAFEGLLNDGRMFAGRLVSALPGNTQQPHLSHIATDGESYGHHHRFGEMALAYALRTIEQEGLARLTNYGEFLDLSPPACEVELMDRSSWSCAHGVERWRSDCGCSDHQHPGWNQAWRRPLRRSFDWLRDAVGPLFEREAGKFYRNPWQARNDYISVILDRSPESVARFLDGHTAHVLQPDERIRAIKLMELQRYAMLMYTSCGWFFEDVARIEAVQVIQYAARVAQLAAEMGGRDIESLFLERLEKANSNDPNYGSARRIYERLVLPARIDLARMVAHYGAADLYEDQPARMNTGAFDIAAQDRTPQDPTPPPHRNVRFGRATVSSRVTLESSDTCYLALLRPDDTLSVGVVPYPGDPTFEQVRREVLAADALPELEEVLRLRFQDRIYTAAAILQDTRYRLIEKVLCARLASLTRLFYPLLKEDYLSGPIVTGSTNPLLESARPLVELEVNLDLRAALQSGALDTDTFRRKVEGARLRQISIDGDHLGYLLTKRLDEIARRLLTAPEDPAALRSLAGMVDFCGASGFPVNWNNAHAAYWRLLHTTAPQAKRRASAGEAAAAAWIQLFISLGEKLSIGIVP